MDLIKKREACTMLRAAVTRRTRSPPTLSCGTRTAAAMPRITMTMMSSSSVKPEPCRPDCPRDRSIGGR